MHQTLVNCHTIFDVGANIGDWAALALNINPSLKLHCFEPSRETYQRLLARGWPPDVILNNFGLGSAQEHRTLYLFDDAAGINSLYKREGLEDGWGLIPQQRTETIWLDTVDHYCQEHEIAEVDYLKIDVEGHELEVLKGASTMLTRGKINVIQFEYGGCNIDARVFLKDIFDFFTPFAYTHYKIFPRELRRVDRYDQRLENFQYQNWVALRTE